MTRAVHHCSTASYQRHSDRWVRGSQDDQLQRPTGRRATENATGRRVKIGFPKRWIDKVSVLWWVDELVIESGTVREEAEGNPSLASLTFPPSNDGPPPEPSGVGRRCGDRARSSACARPRSLSFSSVPHPHIVPPSSPSSPSEHSDPVQHARFRRSPRTCGRSQRLRHRRSQRRHCPPQARLHSDP